MLRTFALDWVPWHLLSVSAIDGTIESSPAGIDCPNSSCSEAYIQGTVVTLSATRDPGRVLGEWAGDPDCIDGVVRFEDPALVVSEDRFELGNLSGLELGYEVLGFAPETIKKPSRLAAPLKRASRLTNARLAYSIDLFKLFSGYLAESKNVTVLVSDVLQPSVLLEEPHELLLIKCQHLLPQELGEELTP